MKFDVISDLHADFYLTSRFGLSVTGFINNLLPENPSEILVIAGDVSNKNKTSAALLDAFTDYYEKVLVAFGNHDLYVEDKSVLEGEDKVVDPFHRWNELKNMLERNSKVVFLEGTTFNYNGVTFGGTGGWYDLSYATKGLGATIKKAEEDYMNQMNDSVYIPSSKTFNWDLTWSEREKVEELAEKVDVMITHVPPTYKQIEERFKLSVLSGCFYFDGEEILDRTTAKVWIMGHTHSLFDVMYKDIRLVNQSLGYPFEAKARGDLIKTIEV